MNDKPLIVALDYADAADALAMAGRLDPARCRVKVGKELFTAAGPDLVRRLADGGFDVFLDLKFHDIPNTVAGACAAGAALGAWMMTVHASGGPAMLEAAKAAVGDAEDAPRLVAITVLTSLDAADLDLVGVGATVEQQVVRLARLAQATGLDGVVCSPVELPAVVEATGTGFLKVTPGVRPAGTEASDQKRVATPPAAIAAGATHLVIGRPVTRAPDPLAALESIEASLAPA